MVVAYGPKSGGHLDEWELQFGNRDPAEFERQVTLVLQKVRYKWPTPGEFNHIVLESKEEKSSEKMHCKTRNATKTLGTGEY